jgi:UDP-3-O-[3-hydroxymyristoyl] glucosamine N-acyltransferase
MPEIKTPFTEMILTESLRQIAQLCISPEAVFAEGSSVTLESSPDGVRHTKIGKAVIGKAVIEAQAQLEDKVVVEDRALVGFRSTIGFETRIRKGAEVRTGATVMFGSDIQENSIVERFTRVEIGTVIGQELYVRGVVGARTVVKKRED